jgi:hypothetical protein
MDRDRTQRLGILTTHVLSGGHHPGDEHCQRGLRRPHEHERLPRCGTDMRRCPMTYYGPRHLANGVRTIRQHTIAIARDIPEEQYVTREMGARFAQTGQQEQEATA